jgi:hypothetical protein
MQMRSGISRLLVLLLGLVVVTAGYLFPAPPPADDVPAKLTYSRTFKGSTPEYLLIVVDSRGSGSCEERRLDEAPSPRAFQVSAGTTRHLFALAGELHYFQSVDLDSHRKVANLGEKTLEYQQGREVNRVVFNHTENRVATELVDIFEKVGTVERHVSSLEFQMKYDPLSLSRELLQIQIELNNKSLVEPALMVPTLERIANNSRFLHLAQVRAQEIIERILPKP